MARKALGEVGFCFIYQNGLQEMLQMATLCHSHSQSRHLNTRMLHLTLSRKQKPKQRENNINQQKVVVDETWQAILCRRNNFCTSRYNGLFLEVTDLQLLENPEQGLS